MERLQMISNSELAGLKLKGSAECQAFKCGTENWTRTSTSVKTLAPEASASTNSATSAFSHRAKLTGGFNFAHKSNTSVYDSGGP